MRLIIYFIMAIMCLSVTAQAQAACGNNVGRGLGTIVGGLAGALAGRSIDGGKNKTLGTVIGGVAGALAGSALGKALDKCEQQKLTAATEASLNSTTPGKPQHWTSDTRPGVSGTIVASSVTTTKDGRICRSVNRVNYVDGQEMQDTPSFCRMPPSTSWSPV